MFIIKKLLFAFVSQNPLPKWSEAPIFTGLSSSVSVRSKFTFTMVFPPEPVSVTLSVLLHEITPRDSPATKTKEGFNEVFLKNQ